MRHPRFNEDNPDVIDLRDAVPSDDDDPGEPYDEVDLVRISDARRVVRRTALLSSLVIGVAAFLLGRSTRPR
jgi:hypothetical protein